MPFLVFLFFLLISCEPSNKKNVTGFAGIAMTVPYRILVGRDLSFLEKRKVQSLIDQTFDEVNHTYNYWNPNSEVSQLNKLKKFEKKDLSPELTAFLQTADKIVRLTEGRFDPTIYPLQKIWKLKLDKGTLPTEAEIKELLPAVGWDKIHFSEGIFWKDNDSTALDLGGIAKGYCVDLIAKKLETAGYQDIYVEWGGEILAKGRHPENRPWKIFISKLGDPDPENSIAIVELKDEAIATSGDYLQNWTVKKESGYIKYTHIIDPRTGYPLISNNHSITSTSVVAPSCVLADCLATALMIPTQNLDWIENIKKEISGIKYWIVYPD
jgi:thiamine biosynthesis lipoprotein